MKKIIVSIVLLLGVVQTSKALPVEVIGRPGYHLQILSESCFAMVKGGGVSSCNSIPIILLPSLNFAPLTIGGAFGAQKPELVIGPSLNILPSVESGVLSVLDIFAPGSFPSFKSLLRSQAVSGPDITFNAGAKWGFLPGVSGGGKGELVLSVGPAIRFN